MQEEPLDGLSQDEIDRVFHALADATRRDVMARVLRSEHSVSALAEGYSMSFAAVQKHVAVLERAGLVVKRKSGREQLVSGNVATIQQAARLLDQLELRWRARLERFDHVLAEDHAASAADPGASLAEPAAAVAELAPATPTPGSRTTAAPPGGG